MANVKFSDLTAVADVAATDLVAVSEDTGGGTFSSKKATASQVADYALGVTAAKGRWVEISRATASSSATIDFTGIDSTYDEYAVAIYSALPATNNADLVMRTSTNGGSSYDAASGDYWWLMTGGSINATYGSATINKNTSFDATITTDIRLSNSHGASGISNTSTLGGWSGAVAFWTPSAANRFRILYEGVYYDATSLYDVRGSGTRATAADVDAIRFLMSSGNITSGTFVLLGRKK